MTYLARMDEDEAVRLAYATLAHVTEYPHLLSVAPFAVLADVLTQPPWSLAWDEAVAFVSAALKHEGSATPHA